MKKGDNVEIKDGNGNRVAGVVHSYGQVSDGTGRHGYFVLVGDSLYWREPADVRRA